MDPDQTLPATGMDSAPASWSGRVIEIPRTLGRYTVLERLGSGATGVVFAAYDPQLDRRVAVKLLKWQGDEAGRQQLLDEARALAKLSHPNVVAVHDVGMLDEQAFIAMAFVDGPTLRGWATESSEATWREQLAVLVAAGRGLAAAHAAGLIHRDFKPDNVIVDRHDDQPRVVDFGLAQAAQPEDSVVDSADEHPGFGVAGTPAYMAPELFEAGPAGVRTDQFSFCVAAYEILYGRRPFGDSLAEIIERMDEERVLEPPAQSPIPTWVRQAILRGLRRDPQRRWESMDALLAALDEDPLRRRRSRVQVGVAGVAVAALSAMVALQIDEPSPPPQCEDAAERLAPAWDAARRDDVGIGMRATRLGYAASTQERVTGRLEAYAETWRAGYEDACRAHARGEQSGRMLDLRMACLARGRDELGALAGALSSIEPKQLARVDQAAERLHDLERCNDVQALAQRVPLPEDPARREAVERVSRLLSENSVLEAFGSSDDAIGRANALVAAAREADYLPLLSQAKLQEGVVLQRFRKDVESVDALDEAMHLALEAGDPAAAAEAATVNVGALGFNLQRHHAAAVRASDARTFIARVRQTNPQTAHELEIGLLIALAGVELRRPEGGDAEAIAREALDALAAQEDSRSSLRVAKLHGIRGWAAQASGDIDGALGYYRQALAVELSFLGPEHPQVGLEHNNLGLMLKNLSRRPEAIEQFEAALTILEAVRDDHDPKMQMVLRNLGGTLLLEHEDERGVRYLDRAWADTPEEISERPGTHTSTIDYAWALERLGRHDDAALRYEQGLRMAELAPRPEKQASFFSYVCDRETRDGRHDRSIEVAERGLETLQSSPEATDVDRAVVSLSLVRALHARGRAGDHARALQLAREALAHFEAAGHDSRTTEAAQLEWMLRNTPTNSSH